MKRPQDAHKKYTYPVPTMIIIRPVQAGLVYSMGKSRRRGASRNGAASTEPRTYRTVFGEHESGYGEYTAHHIARSVSEIESNSPQPHPFTHQVP